MKTRYNTYSRYIKIQEITQEHYEECVTTYKGIWRKYIYPVFFIDYNTYMKILAEGNLTARQEQEKKKKEENKYKQQSLFDAKQ